MQVINQQTGRTMKRITLVGVVAETDTEVVKAAMQAAGETPSTLFGWSVDRYPRHDQAIVTLHTD